jgi:fluoride ion exporter CrcB/FEX
MSPDDALSTVDDVGMPKWSTSGDRTVAGLPDRFVGRHPWGFVIAGAMGGFALGAMARLWMRWISVNPEFSWAGTIGIVASFTVFAAAQSVAAVARIRSGRPGMTAAARAGAGLLSAGLFGAAGALMLPTVLFGSIAVWRLRSRRPMRVLFFLLALPSVVIVLMEIVDDHEWSIASIGRMLMFLGIYAAVIAATWPTAAPVEAGWRPPRRLVVVAVLLILGFLGLALYLGGVQ